MNTTYENQPSPSNYLIWSIVNTVLSVLICCLNCLAFPGIATGIAAIVFSSKVNRAIAEGNLAEAARAASTAKILNWITSGLLALCIIVFFIILISIGLEEYMRIIKQSSGVAW